MSTSEIRPLSGWYNSSNAFESIRDRMPFILTKVIDFMSRTASDHLVNNQQEKGDDAKSVVGRLVRLKNELQTDKLLLPLTCQHGDEQIWNDFLQTVPTLDQRKVRWFNVKWITCECYMYRRINEALQLSTHHKQVDPFFEQKAAAFHSASKAVSSLAALLLKPQPACKENFDVFLEYSLWGNKCDLSIAPNADNQVGTCDERVLLKRHILCNHTDQVWNYIAQLRPKQGKVKITFILDNAGFELFCDVCLADYLLSSELCDVIEFHVKDLPWFVSDVATVDFTWMIEQCENFQPSSDVRELGARWRSFVQDGRFCVVNDVYWTLPHDFTTMQEHRSQLYDKLKQSDLLVFKGDLNYRKLIGDMQWDPTTSIAEASKPFLPSPWLTLRTIKCETVVNIPTGKSEQMYEIESDWMLKGNYAVISFCQ